MHPPVAHLLVAAALTALAVVQTAGEARGIAVGAAGVAGTLAVVLLARAPLAVAAVASAAAVAQVALHDEDPLFASFLTLMAACYGLGRREDRLRLGAGLAMVAAVVGALLQTDPELRRVGQLVFPLVYFGGAVVIGRVVRAREQSADTALAAAAAEAEAREQAALAAERARIAREMHDSVAHSVSLLVLQAESAAALLDNDPQRALVQMERVAEGGRQALDELRRLLGVLRSDDDAGQTVPQPSLASLDELADAVRRTGTEVDVDVGPGLDALSPGLQLTAYRVVQESLTNAVRHGRARRLTVRLRRCADELLIEVADDGTPGGEPDVRGHGLIGMQERLRLYDGDLDAGPAPDGGWRVAARARATAP